MSKPIYLDYNATTPHDSEVIDAMRPFLEEEFGPEVAASAGAACHSDRVEVSYVLDAIGAPSNGLKALFV